MELLLEQHSEMAGKAVLVQVINPARSDTAEVKEMIQFIRVSRDIACRSLVCECDAALGTTGSVACVCVGPATVLPAMRLCDCFTLCLPPSLSQETAQRINQRFGSGSYQPVVLIERAMPLHERMALFTVAEVAVVTATRDGMNLLPYEVRGGRVRTDL